MANKYRIHVNHITSFWQKEYKSGYSTAIKKIVNEKSIDNLNVGYRQSRLISKSSAKKITDAVQWLELIAKTKVYTTKNGKKFVHKLQMITLTVPDDCGWDDKEIMKKAFQPVLDNLRTNYAMNNYIWRAEAQERGEIHFHIITDCPIGYWVILKIWNDRLSKVGLLDEWRVQRRESGESKIVKSKYKYFNENPNSADIKRIPRGCNIENYIAKYISKKTKGKEPRRLTIRHYGLSYSLSRLKEFRQQTEELAELIFHHAMILPNVKRVKKEWCDYIGVKLKRIWAIWDFIETACRDELWRICGLQPCLIKSNQITTDIQMQLFFEGR